MLLTPAFSDSRIYYMRQIMHDWPDKKCHTILTHIAQAMDHDSRLLIDDYVMPPVGAEFRPIHMDICMMMYLKAMERTETQWRNLLEGAGFEVIKIWTPPTSFESIIEAKIKS
jgi:demethylsterigmatocystin 6-O-methyltransferase